MNSSEGMMRGMPLRGVMVWVVLAMLAGCGSLPQISSIGEEEGRTGELGERSVESPADLYVSLAVEYLKRRKYPQALQNAKEALAKDNANPDAHNVIALIYDQLDESQLAERHFRQALALQPKNSYYRNAYGFFLCKRKRYDAAEREFLAALQNPLYTTPEVAWNNAGMCVLRKGNTHQAEEYFLKALRHDPRVSTALIEMADISFQQDKVALAKNYLRRFHEVSSQTARSLFLGIRIARKLGDHNTAASYELKLRSNYPDSKEYRQLMGAG